MPKKMGINTKAVEAKERKEATKKAKEEQIQRKKDDELWKDDDKLVNRKLERQNDREQKKLEQAQKKAQLRAAYEEEQSQLASSAKPTSKPKVTRAHILNFIEKQDAEKGPAKKQLILDTEITENINRMNIEGDEARNIEEAITILSTNNESEIDRHPERRLKAAFAAFEEINLPRLKNENPNLRLSQLKQMLKKDWMKSPDNPLNQRTLAYNAKV